MNLKSKVQQSSWGILIFLSVLWGCSFILIKKALISFDPIQLGCLRMGISSLAFAPMVWWHRKDIEWNRLPLFIAVGLTGSGIPAFLFAYAQTQVSSSLAGLLNSLTPIWTLIIGLFLFRLKFSNLKLTGVITGFIGAGMLILLGNGGLSNGVQWHGLLIVVATVCYGSSVNMVQAFFGNTKPVIISSMSFFVIGLPALIWLFTTDFLHVMAHDEQSWKSLGAVTFLALFGTVLASMVFYYLVQKTSAVFGSTVTYLMPVVALAWGIVDGESISMLHLGGLSLILAGVYFTKKE